MKNLTLYLFLFIFGLSCSITAQEHFAVRELYDSDFRIVKDSLLKIYGKNKIIPKEFEIPIIAALSRYPELKNTFVEFKYKNIKTTMAARPRPKFIFKKNSKRNYIILINDINRKNKTVLLNDIPFNAQIGVIGHELAHIVDYENKSKTKIIYTGISYLFSNYKKKLESKIDIIAIQHGLAWQIFDFSYFILKESKAKKEYKEYKRDNYFRPGELIYIANNVY